ncbi:hypothetical protein, partial [Mesorhizobium sp.]|uniref:hypothetical protein n=1 Tax=Mesorhizobium sp. TaxID=1871066 RepID=UPI00257FD6B2
MKTRPRRQQVDRCFVECGHRSKRARDQVQFVLDDKIRRIEPMPVSEGADRAPWRGVGNGIGRRALR